MVTCTDDVCFCPDIVTGYLILGKPNEPRLRRTFHPEIRENRVTGVADLSIRPAETYRGAISLNLNEEPACSGYDYSLHRVAGTNSKT